MIVTIHLTSTYSETRKVGAYAYLISSPQGRLRLCGSLKDAASETDVQAHCLGTAFAALLTSRFTEIDTVRIFPASARKLLEDQTETGSSERVFGFVYFRRVRDKFPKAVVEFREDPAGEPWGEKKVKSMIWEIIKNH